MFYDEFVKLCNMKNVSRTKACMDCGVSRTAWHKWESGATPNGTTINKFAAYFGVSVAQLLGEENNIAPTEIGERDILDDVDIAFYGDFKELNEDEKETVRDMVRLMRQRKEKRSR